MLVRLDVGQYRWLAIYWCLSKSRDGNFIYNVASVQAYGNLIKGMEARLGREAADLSTDALLGIDEEFNLASGSWYRIFEVHDG